MLKKHLSDIICAFCFALLVVWGALFPPISNAGVEFSNQNNQENCIEIADCRVTFKFFDFFK